MRRRTKIGLGLVGAVIAAGLLSFSPLVRAKAAAQAAQRGADVEIGAVRPGWGRIWLRNVAVKIPDVPALTVTLDAVEVDLGLSLLPKRVRAHGGRVTLHGPPDEVARQVAAWRAKRPASAEHGSSLPYSVDGLAVTWSDARPEADPEYAWGAGYERDGETERVGADLVRIRLDGVDVEATRTQVQLGRRDGHRVVERVTADSVLASVDLESDWVRRSLHERSKDTVVTAVAAKPGANARPRLGFDTARFLDADRGPRLRRSLAHAATVMSDTLPENGELDLSGLHVRLHHGAESLSVGPARLHVVRGEAGVSIALMPAPDASEALRLALELPLGDKEVKASIEGGPVSLGALGVQEGDFGLLDVDKATLEAKANAVLSADGRSLRVVGSGKLASLALERKWLASVPVRGISLGLRGRVQVELDGSRVSIAQGELALGKLRVALDGELAQAEDHQKIQLAGGVPLASCQSLLDSAPDGLAPVLAGMRMTGTFALDGRIEVDTRHLDDMVTRWNVVNECRISETPADVAPRRFFRPFSREVLDADGRPVTVQTGPGTPGWAPRMGISRNMETAVLICEDGAFLRHHGFDEEAIRNSIRENVKAGRFLRGASTISMQTAKNLYLSRQKTLSRKLQEAVLTLLLEQELTKDQILELYLNVIEFGPGIYGIGPAAQYYFNASAGQLSLGQSLYLASILPNPKRQYFGADGVVAPGWLGYLRKLMHIAAKIHRVTPEELDDALTEQVTFKVPYSPRTPRADEALGDGAEANDGARLDSEQTVGD
jgi:Transglycosylase